MLSRIKLAAGVTVGSLALMTGLAAANALPGAAQDVASQALETVGVSVSGPNAQAGDQPDNRGASTQHDTAGAQDQDQATEPEVTEADSDTTSNGPSATDATQPDNHGACVSAAAHDPKNAGTPDDPDHHGDAVSTAARSDCGKPPTGPDVTGDKGTAPDDQGQQAPAATPNGGGTGTDDTASDGASDTGTDKADTASQGHSSAGSDNAGGHRP